MCGKLRNTISLIGPTSTDNIVHPVLLDKVLFDNRLCTYFDALAGSIGTSATSKLTLKTQWLKQAVTHTNKASGNTVNLRSVPKALYTAVSSSASS